LRADLFCEEELKRGGYVRYWPIAAAPGRPLTTHCGRRAEPIADIETERSCRSERGDPACLERFLRRAHHDEIRSIAFGQPTLGHSSMCPARASGVSPWVESASGKLARGALRRLRTTARGHDEEGL
jgi:hypothetical protein